MGHQMGPLPLTQAKNEPNRLVLETCGIAGCLVYIEKNKSAIDFTLEKIQIDAKSHFLTGGE